MLANYILSLLVLCKHGWGDYIDLHHPTKT